MSARPDTPATTDADVARVRLSFAWYDLWVGAFYDRKQRRLYVCPLPCVLFTFSLRTPR